MTRATSQILGKLLTYAHPAFKIKKTRAFIRENTPESDKEIYMLGNFTYSNPTRLYFGKDALDGLNEELPKYGKNVLLVYGGGSIKKN